MTRTKLQVVNVTTNYTSDGSKIINGHKFIDLGLPSGLLWAETNIGAETAYDDGNYYAWGETVPQSGNTNTYNVTFYKYCSCSDNNEYCSDGRHYTKYNATDNKTVLDKEDNVAYVNWGSFCRIPTYSEFLELANRENCTWTWMSRRNSAGETVKYYKVVSKKNYNIIYLPASGERTDRLYDHGLWGYYWSSTLSDKSASDARCLYFGGNDYSCSGQASRFQCRSVRPVAEP